MAPQACSYARFSAVALCLASVAGLARTQAPHDREQGCLDDSSHPQYDDHVRPLLDTRDYSKLLPYDSDGAGGVWQTLDSDGDGVKWRTPSPVYCNEVVNVCGRSSGHQDNWMITQHVSVPDNVTTVQVMIDSRLDASCVPSAQSCVDDLSLYVWETPTQNRLLATNTSNYHFIGNISSGERVIKISPLSQSGFYLGIRDNGTCASVSRVLVYYSVCEAGSESLVRVDQNTSAGNTLQGHCVENSVSTSDSGPPLLECQESGRWRVVSGCQCSAHYFLDHSRDLCLKPPPAPRDVRVRDVTNQTFTLSWSPPPADGPPQYDTHYNVSYGDQEITVEGATEMNVTGLTPFFSYTFSVTAENSVSSQDTDNAARTTSVSATTLEGVAGRVEVIEIREGPGDDFISWSEPRPPHGIILHYYIRIIESGKETLIKDYNSTTISWDTWRNKWKITTSENVKVQIQAETSVGRGEYSEEVDVFPPAETQDNSETSSVSTELLIIVIMVPVLVLLILIVVVIILISCISSVRRKIPPTPTAPLVNEIEDYASIKLSPTDTPTTLVVSSAPPLPRSPCPKKQNQSFPMNMEANNNTNCGGEDPTYHVLEGPPATTQGSDGNPYSLDPIDSTEIFGEPRINYHEDGHQSQSGAVEGFATGWQERVYFELEGPGNSSLIKNRTINARNPTYESVKSSAAYWNEGLGPDQPKLHTLMTSSEDRPRVSSHSEAVVSESSRAGGPTPTNETV